MSSGSRRRPHRKTLPQPHGQGAERHRRVTRDSVTGLRARALSRVEHAWNWCPHRRYVADTNRDAGPLAPYDVRLLALEDMTLYEQVAALRATTLLVGVHGSGLNNALYLRPGAAVLQIVPFGLRYRGDFEGIATRNGVSYGELVLEDRRRSVFHWEFLDPERLVAGRAAVLDAGSPPGGREVYAFWVNQDVVVPRAAFLGAVRGAAASPLNRRLLAG